MDPIFGPMLAQIGLGLAVVLVLGVRRVSAMRSLGLEHIRTKGWPLRTVNTNDNLRNQFEIPVLFLALCLFFTLAGETTGLVLALAWAYVALRLFHAAVQLTSNVIFPWRFGSFVVSTVLVLALWVVAGLQYLSSL